MCYWPANPAIRDHILVGIVYGGVNPKYEPEWKYCEEEKFTQFSSLLEPRNSKFIVDTMKSKTCKDPQTKQEVSCFEQWKEDMEICANFNDKKYKYPIEPVRP